MLALLVLAGALVALVKFSHKPRRAVTGRSGHVWFTVVHATPDRRIPETTLLATHSPVTTEVFASEKGNDLVLKFEQASDQTRRVIFRAPSTLTAIAEKDFIG